MKHLRLIVYIPLLVLGGYFLLRMFVFSPKEELQLCQKEMNSSFHGKIVAITKVPDNPKCEYIVLDGGRKILQPYTFGLDAGKCRRFNCEGKKHIGLYCLQDR